MSELKTYNSERIYWAVEQVEQEAGDIEDLHLDDNLLYIKSEVDKVIAEKDAKIIALDAEVFKQKHHAKLFFDERNYAETSLRHSKYKRCLATAKWCDAEADVADADGDYEDMRWYQKWHKRWLAIAEQFKEAK